MIDLHMHTINSDGSETVEEVLKMCQEKKLEYISITDHNTCKAYYGETVKNNKIFNGIIIKGCELNAEFQNKSIEILGYDIDPNIIMEWREKYYSKDKIRENTKQIYDRFLNILDRKGLIYNEKDIMPLKNDNEFIETPIMIEIIKHQENKEILGEEYFNSRKLFYRKEITNPDSEYFLNRASTFPKVKEVIDIIHKAGGKAFFAHPYEYKFENTIKFIDDLRKEVDLDGIECFHPSADEEKMSILVDYTRTNNLYISGGSDYHGKPKPDIEIGIGTGNLNISKEIIEEWINNNGNKNNI